MNYYHQIFRRFPLLFSLFFLFNIFIPAQQCIDLGVGIGVSNEEIALIDFFKAGGEWEVEGNNDHPWYKVNTLDSFKVVNGAYYHWDIDWSGTVNNEAWGNDWADCFISYWDMMVDQGRIRPDGYPVQFPTTVYKYRPKSIDPNQSANPASPVQITSFSRRIYFPQGLPLEGWVLKWKGRGRIRYEGIEVTSSDVPSTDQGESWRPDESAPYAGRNYMFDSRSSSAGGRVECRKYWMVHGYVLNILESDPADPIRDIVFLYPGLEDEYDAGQKFNPLFLERMQQFKCLRYMGYLNSNGIEGRTVMAEGHPFHDSHMLARLRWDERTPENYYIINNGNGGNYEIIIDLANATHTDPWVNIPYCAGTDYVDNMIQLFMEGLDPDLTLYIEVGNEMWNFGAEFNGFFWQARLRVREYPGLGDVEARGAFINEMFQQVTETAGARNLQRIKRVVGGFPRYYDVNNRTVQMIDPSYWDALATTWYFDLSYENDGDNECRDPNTGTSWRELLYNWHLAHPTDQTGFNQLYSQYLLNEFRCEGSYANNVDVLLANYYNKELYCYEGGNHTFYGCTNSPERTALDGELDFNTPTYPDYITDNSFINAICIADESDEVGNVYREVIDSLQSAGIRLANHLSFAGGSSCYGVWSFIQPRDITQPLSYLLENYGKFQAFSERIASDNCGQLEIILEQDSVGPGLSMLLDGINDYVQGQTTFVPNETSDYTVESWFMPLFLDREQVILSFSNDGSNNNYNVIKVRADGKILWEIGNNSSFTAKLIGSTLAAEKWYHVAAVKSGQRYSLYINGIIVASGNYTIPSSPRNNFTIGAIEDDGVSGNWFTGNLDEVRLWDIARSTNDIREYMCKKIPNGYVNFSNLRCYYRFDEPDYANLRVYDRTTRNYTGYLRNITITSRSRYAVSGAALGDYSRNRYSATWDGVSLSITHPQGDMAAVSNIGEGNPEGIQVYIIDGESHYNEVPEYYLDISDERVLGVFMVNGTNPNYDITYVYNGNPDALSGAAEVDNRLLRRDMFSTEDWLHAGATLNTTANSLSVSCKETERGEYNLGSRHEETIRRPGSGMALLNNQAPTEETEGLLRYLDLEDYTITFWARGWGNAFNLTQKLGDCSQRFTINPAWQTGVNCELRHIDETWGSQYVSSPSYVAERDEWSHYAITRSGTRVTIYVNGLQVAQNNLTSSFPIQEMHLFHDPAWQTGNYPGGVCNLALDELSVWNTALDISTIRDWMCKKINEEHPYECENLVLYFNFDQGAGNILEDKRGPSDIQLITVGSGFQYISSGAAIGDESTADYSTPNAITFAHPDGDYLEATRSSGSSAGVHLYRIDHMPPVPTTSNNAGIVAMDSTRYWGLFAANPYGVDCQYSILNHYENNSQVNLANEANLRLLSRFDNATSPWVSNIGVLPNVTQHTLSITNQTRGEYVLGGTNANAFNGYTAPETPIFLTQTEDLNIDTICGNTTGLVYAVENDPSVETYLWTIPAGLDGFSVTDSIVLNASYAGSAIDTFTISVIAVNAYGESAPATYDIIVMPAPTIADAGPDQIVLPPLNSATMDGNSPALLETGLWALSTGSGTITDENNPLTPITGLGNGNSSFIWAISNSICPPSLDSMNILLAPPPQNVVLENGDPLPAVLCEGSVITVRVIPAEDVDNDGYQWTMPTGLQLITQNNDLATIQVNSGIGGSILVAAIYGGSLSENYESQPINISALPNRPVFIEYPEVLCLNVDVLVRAQFDSEIDSFEWNLPYGIYPVEFPKSTSETIEIQAIDVTTGYISARTFNNGCSSEFAIDSFAFTVGEAPDMPELFLGTDGGTADQFCGEEYALLWVQNIEEGIMYEWIWDVYTELVDYLDTNRSSALFLMPDRNNEIRVRATNSENACSTSEWFLYNGWTQEREPGVITSVTLTNPVGQDPLNLQIGTTYTFEVDGTGDYYYWDVPVGFELIDDGDIHDEVNQIRVLQEAAGNLDVYTITLRGCSSHSHVLPISTGNALFPPEYISGSLIACQGSNLTITVSDVGATGYIWTLPNGTVYTTATPVLDEMIMNPMKGIMTIEATDGSFTSTPLELEIEVRAAFLDAVGFVDEDNNTIDEIELCSGDNGRPIYHRDALAGSYIWEIHGTAMEFFPRYEPGHDGDNDYELENRSSPVDTMMPVNWVNWRCRNDGADGGYIVVTAVNGCGGANVIDSIYYYWAQPLTLIVPEFIEAPTELCVGSSASYQVAEIQGANQYIWQLPNGLTASDIVTTSPAITVDVANGTGGILSVYAMGEVCGGSSTIPQTTEEINISGEPLDFYFVEEPLAACPGENVTYEVNDIGAGVYNWSIPEGLGSTRLDDDDVTGITITGSWSEEDRDNMINQQYRAANNDGTRSIVYTPNLANAGTYRVSLSYFSDWNSVANMPVTINHSNGTEQLYVDTRINPEDGIWHTLGEYEFNAGSGGSVTIFTQPGGDGVSVADAVKFEIVSIPGGTSQTFPVSEGDGGAVCVSVNVPQCASEYSICSNPVNLGGTIEDPVFTEQENSVCEGLAYTYRSLDIGGDTYTWYLPAGMSIDGETGTIEGLGREVLVTMAADQGTPVRIGVQGVVSSCNIESEIVYTNDITFDGTGCMVAEPVFLQHPDTVCLGSDATYIVTAVQYADSYQWTLPAGLRQTISLQTGIITTTVPYITVEPTGAGTGELDVITVVAQSNTIVDSDPVSTLEAIVVDETPVFTVSVEDITSCGEQNGAMTLTGLNANSIYNLLYSHNGINTGPVEVTSDLSGNVTIDTLSQGFFTEITINPGGCSSIQDGPYTIDDPSTIEITNIEYFNSDTCGGPGRIQLSITGTNNGDLFDIDLNNNNINDSVDAVNGGIIVLSGFNVTTGFSGITITDQNSLCSATSAISGIITISEAADIINVDINDPLACGGNGSVVIILENGYNGEVYDLDYNNDGVIDNSATVTGNQLIVNSLSAGDEINNIEITNQGSNCNSAYTINHIIADPTTVTITNAETVNPVECLTEGQLIITTTGATEGDGYNVDYNNDGFAEVTGIVTGGVIEVNVPGDAEIDNLLIIGVTDNCRISAIFNDTLFYPPLPDVSLSGLSDFCANDSVHILSEGLPAGGTYNYNGGTISAIEPQELGVGTHSIEYTYTDNNNCSNTDYDTIIINPLPIFEIEGDSVVCPGAEEMTFTSAENSLFSYLWNVTDGEIQGETTESEILVNWSNAERGRVWLLVTDNQTGCADTATLIVALTDSQSPEIVSCDSNYIVPGSVDAQGWFYIFTEEDDSRLIPSGEDDCSNDNLTISFILNEGNILDYTNLYGTRINAGAENVILWRIADNSGNYSECQTSFEFEIEEFIPSAFSPNGDNVNDNWEIAFLLQHPQCVVKVYNRWGIKVYESETGYPENWNGESNGKKLPVDSYFYVITLGDDGREFKGYLTIIY